MKLHLSIYKGIYTKCILHCFPWCFFSESLSKGDATVSKTFWLCKKPMHWKMHENVWAIVIFYLTLFKVNLNLNIQTCDKMANRRLGDHFWYHLWQLFLTYAPSQIIGYYMCFQVVPQKHHKSLGCQSELGATCNASKNAVTDKIFSKYVEIKSIKCHSLDIFKQTVLQEWEW